MENVSEDTEEILFQSKVVRRFLDSLEDLEIQKPLAERFCIEKKKAFEELVGMRGIKGKIRRFFLYERFRKELIGAEERVKFIKRLIRAHGIISKGICENNPLHLEAISVLLQLLIEKVERNKQFFDDIPHSSSLGLLDKSRELCKILEKRLTLV